VIENAQSADKEEDKGTKGERGISMPRFLELQRDKVYADMRYSALLLIMVAGCSTAPVADVMDYFAPGRLAKPDVAPYGGVCNPGAPAPGIGALPPGVLPPGVQPPGAVPGGVLPPPNYPAGSPAPASQPPLPPGSAALPSAPAPAFPTSAMGGAGANSQAPGAVLSLPAIDTTSPH
jgi:hypothetical protein